MDVLVERCAVSAVDPHAVQVGRPTPGDPTYLVRRIDDMLDRRWNDERAAARRARLGPAICARTTGTARSRAAESARALCRRGRPRTARRDERCRAPDAAAGRVRAVPLVRPR